MQALKIIISLVDFQLSDKIMTVKLLHSLQEKTSTFIIQVPDKLRHLPQVFKFPREELLQNSKAFSPNQYGTFCQTREAFSNKLKAGNIG